MTSRAGKSNYHIHSAACVAQIHTDDGQIDLKAGKIQSCRLQCSPTCMDSLFRQEIALSVSSFH